MPLHRRAATVVGLVVAAATLVAGCTSPAPEPTPSATVAPEPDPTADAPEPAPEPTGDAPEPAPEPEPDPEDSPEPPTDADGRTVVTPFISYAGPGSEPGTVEVAGLVPDVIEEGGTCTATVVGTDLSVTGQAFADATSTSCELLVLRDVPDGAQVVLSYRSDDAAGESEPVEVAR